MGIASSTNQVSRAQPARGSRPWTVTALSVFFAFGATISGLSLVALALPGSFLEPMWRLNPRAREQFATMGGWALLLMAVVSVLCAATAYGLWRGSRLGFVLGVTMLLVSLLGDLANAVLGLEPRAWVGVPVAALLLWVLTTGRARAFFSSARPR
jgi:predicted ferric reductase